MAVPARACTIGAITGLDAIAGITVTVDIGGGPLRTEEQVNLAVERYADMIKRICLLRLKSPQDTDDVFQSVFLKYLDSTKEFKSADQEKAWFIRVTLNACTDWLRGLARRRTLPIDAALEEAAAPEESRALLEAVLALPDRYRDVIYLHYYEGYSAVEIGHILGRRENTVYTLLARARALLRKELGGDQL